MGIVQNGSRPNERLSEEENESGISRLWDHPKTRSEHVWYHGNTVSQREACGRNTVEVLTEDFFRPFSQDPMGWHCTDQQSGL